MDSGDNDHDGDMMKHNNIRQRVLGKAFVLQLILDSDDNNGNTINTHLMEEDENVGRVLCPAETMIMKVMTT